MRTQNPQSGEEGLKDENTEPRTHSQGGGELLKIENPEPTVRGGGVEG